MKTITHKLRAGLAGLALTTLLAAVPAAAAPPGPASDAPPGPASDARHVSPWQEVPHRHGPPSKRWTHRYAHPVPEPAVLRSIRPKQYGPPHIGARSRIRGDRHKATCCASHHSEVSGSQLI